jgi:hypothetical protein
MAGYIGNTKLISKQTHNTCTHYEDTPKSANVFRKKLLGETMQF